MATTEDGKIKKVKEIPALSFISSAELSQKQLEPPRFIVENLIPEGLTLLVAPSKSFKSWMSLDLAISVATGTKFLNRMTRQGTALYAALEDSEYRLKERQEKVFNGRPAPEHLYITRSAANLDNGLIDQLEMFVQKNPDTQLIIIDTFQMVRSMNNSRNAYSKDYKDCGRLKEFADKHRLAMILVHHTSKFVNETDPFANINGTTGIMGAADTAIMMTRADKETGFAKMNITGRDIQEEEYQMRFDFTKFRWQIEGSTEQVAERTATEVYEKNPIVRTIRKILQENNKEAWTGSATDIINLSIQYGFPIKVKAQQLGKNIEALQDELRSRDFIEYNTINNGSGSKKHRFSFVASPFEE